MSIKVEEKNGSRVAVAQFEGIAIENVNDALDIMAETVHVHNSSKLVIDRSAFGEDFFDLSTKKLGDVLQKYTNYNFVIAITGGFDDLKSRSLRAFIVESNRRGDRVLFITSKEKAIDALHAINA